MQTVVSVKKPMRCAGAPPERWIAISVTCGGDLGRWSRLGATPGGVARTPARRKVPLASRPARTSQANALDSWIDTFGSPLSAPRSLAAPPWSGPAKPQCHGMATWWMMRSSTFSGLMRSVTTARTAISARGLLTVIQPPSSMPRSRASSGSISANIAGCSSSSQGSQRDMAPAVWCSVRR